MTNKSVSANELAVDWISDDLWSDLLRDEIKLRKIILKGGLGDWLCVLTARVDGKPMVAFVGAATLSKVVRKVHEHVRTGEIKWKDDRYGT